MATARGPAAAAEVPEEGRGLLLQGGVRTVVEQHNTLAALSSFIHRVEEKLHFY